MPEKRVVLIKPGEVLLIGNAGNLCLESVSSGDLLRQISACIGIEVVVFAGDIDIDVLSADGTAEG